jgi:hypothetical protein
VTALLWLLIHDWRRALWPAIAGPRRRPGSICVALYMATLSPIS